MPVLPGGRPPHRLYASLAREARNLHGQNHRCMLCRETQSLAAPVHERARSVVREELFAAPTRIKRRRERGGSPTTPRVPNARILCQKGTSARVPLHSPLAPRGGVVTLCCCMSQAPASTRCMMAPTR